MDLDAIEQAMCSCNLGVQRAFRKFSLIEYYLWKHKVIIKEKAKIMLL